MRNIGLLTGMIIGGATGFSLAFLKYHYYYYPCNPPEPIPPDCSDTVCPLGHPLNCQTGTSCPVCTCTGPDQYQCIRNYPPPVPVFPIVYAIGTIAGGIIGGLVGHTIQHIKH